LVEDEEDHGCRDLPDDGFAVLGLVGSGAAMRMEEIQD